MSLTVQLYKWHKRVNSTKLPGVADPHTDFSCTLKEPTSIHNPVIILATNDCDFTYAHISAWSRYYFVEDVVYVHNGLVEYHLTEDYLGSNKTAIGSTVANIAYASNHYNTFIVDPRIKVGTSRYSQSETSSAIFSSSTGYYLLSVFDNNNVPASNGMATTYLINDMMLTFLKYWMSGSTVLHALNTYFDGDPLQAIFSIKWVPYYIGDTYADSINGQEMYIGDQHFTVPSAVNVYTCRRLKNFATNSVTFSFDHFFKWQDFRRCPPYTTASMFLPGIGNVDINPSDFIGSDKVYVTMNLELVSGNVMYLIKDQLGRIVATESACLAYDIPYGRTASSYQGYMGAMTGIMGGIGATLVGTLSGNLMLGVGGAATTLASAANTALSANRRSTSVVGGSGSRACILYPYIKYTEYAVDTEDPTDANYIAKFGRPVCETHAINTHSGYVQTIGASVSLDADKEEIETVNRMLDAGIYYE